MYYTFVIDAEENFRYLEQHTAKTYVFHITKLFQVFAHHVTLVLWKIETCKILIITYAFKCNKKYNCTSNSQVAKPSEILTVMCTIIKPASCGWCKPGFIDSVWTSKCVHVWVCICVCGHPQDYQQLVAWCSVIWTPYHWRRKPLKVRGATLLSWSDFLLQKLQSYGELLNLRGAMAPLPPYFRRLCSIWLVNQVLQLLYGSCSRYQR